jgi:hypothetical protein
MPMNAINGLLYDVFRIVRRIYTRREGRFAPMKTVLPRADCRDQKPDMLRVRQIFRGDGTGRA